MGAASQVSGYLTGLHCAATRRAGLCNRREHDAPAKVDGPLLTRHVHCSVLHSPAQSVARSKSMVSTNIQRDIVDEPKPARRHSASRNGKSNRRALCPTSVISRSGFRDVAGTSAPSESLSEANTLREEKRRNSSRRWKASRNGGPCCSSSGDMPCTAFASWVPRRPGLTTVEKDARVPPTRARPAQDRAVASNLC